MPTRFCLSSCSARIGVTYWALSRTSPANSLVLLEAERVEAAVKNPSRPGHTDAVPATVSQDAARTLSGMLLGPIARELRGRRLVIVADGALQYVPFAMLPSPLLAHAVRRTRSATSRSETALYRGSLRS